MEKSGERIILLGRDLELRIISLIVRAREISQQVIFFDLGSEDETIELAEEVGCPVYNLDSELSCQDLSKYILESDLDSNFTNLLIKISDDWKLSDFPIVENRSKESWDVFIAFTSEESDLIEKEGLYKKLWERELAVNNFENNLKK